MEYWEEINSKLKPWIDSDLNKTVVDLFAGCGGLSLGFEANGFKTIGYEMDENATKTYNKNLIGECFNEKLTKETIYPKADIVYVTAFLDRAKFRKFMTEIAWETEVWIADNPDHMVHFNGDKFLGPYKG